MDCIIPKGQTACQPFFSAGGTGQRWESYAAGLATQIQNCLAGHCRLSPGRPVALVVTDGEFIALRSRSWWHFKQLEMLASLLPFTPRGRPDKKVVFVSEGRLGVMAGIDLICPA